MLETEENGAGTDFPEGKRVTENIVLCPDGVYRWIYEFPMMKNPVILFTVFKVLGLSAGTVYLFVLALTLWDGAGVNDVLSLTGVFLLVLLFIFVLSAVAYVLVAWSYGWKYIVLFEMDDRRVTHTQTGKQFTKAQALGWLASAAAFVSGSCALAGAGLSAASRGSSTSVFEHVRKVRGNRRRGTVRVGQLLSRNQVYAAPGDYDFVYCFIAKRCVNAKSVR